jgi:hypothetical protein
MVLDRDFLIKIRTSSTEWLLRQLYYGNLTEEQREAILEELERRGYSEKVMREREKLRLEPYLREYYPVEQYPELYNYIVSEISYMFWKYNIPWRLGLKEFQITGFQNISDYLVLLDRIRDELIEKKTITKEIDEKITALMHTIQDALRRIERQRRGFSFSSEEDYE